MIRYVLAVALTVAILGIGFVAVERGGTAHGEHTLETAVADVESAALELYRTEALPLPGDPPPQRLLEVQLPTEGPVGEPTERFEIHRLGHDHSRLTYRVAGRAPQTETLAVPLIANGPLDLDGTSGHVHLRLRLVADAAGRPVVDVAVRR